MPMQKIAIIIENRNLWQYSRYEPTLTDAGAPDNFPGNSTLFKYKQN